MTKLQASPGSSDSKRVTVLSSSELRASPIGSRNYFEHATIKFPAGQLVKYCSDNSETSLVSATEVHAKRRVRKRDWKPLGPWLFHYCNRPMKWEETREVCSMCGTPKEQP